MTRALFILAIAASIAGCGRHSDSHGGRIAPGARGPVMEGYVNPAGLKVPARAVSAVPSGGYWNCEGNRPEHAARCTLNPSVRIARTTPQER